MGGLAFVERTGEMSNFSVEELRVFEQLHQAIQVQFTCMKY
jgi:hypothetical protein